MTKGETRKARKAARTAGLLLDGELAIKHQRETDTNGPACEFSETPQGYDARERWARHYDDLSGAPEGEWDH